MAVSIWQILILLGGLFILVWPCLAALASRKAKGWDKALWFLLSLAFSWIGYLAYYFAWVRNAENTPPADGRIWPKRR